MREGETLTAIAVPKARARERHVIREAARLAGDHAIVDLAVAVRDGAHRIAAFGAGPTPLLCTAAMEKLDAGDLDGVAMNEMQAAGLTISELPDDQKEDRVQGLPDIVQPWLDQTGDDGKAVLSAYLDALRERGAEPLRARDEGRLPAGRGTGMSGTDLDQAHRPETETIPHFFVSPRGAAIGSAAAILSSAGTIWIGLPMLLIVADMIGRTFFDAPITGASEIAGRSVVANTIFAAFASGTVAGSSVLGMPVPPSLLLIVYGVPAEASIGGMFIAGIIPGLMLAAGSVAMLMCLALIASGFVFTDPEAPRDRRLGAGIAMPLGEMGRNSCPSCVWSRSCSAASTAAISAPARRAESAHPALWSWPWHAAASTAANSSM